MTNPQIPDRAALASASATLERLPHMGSVMINTRQGGATHERMGEVEEVTIRDGCVHIRGAAHASDIDLAEIAEAVVDRTGKMGDKVLPRIDFSDAAGETVFSVIGMAGIEPFDAGLETLAMTPLDLSEAAPRGPREEVEILPTDPGFAVLETARTSGAAIAIEISRPGFRQVWSGAVEAVRPAMGFINVMRPDFHLHLRAGAVAGWRRERGEGRERLVALDDKGDETGLSIEGDPGAWAGASL